MTSHNPSTAFASAQTPSTFVFIHGFLDGSAVWDAVVAHLGDRAADALCVDLPGLGKRAGEPGPYSLDRFAEDVATQVRALARPIILVGQSMGAQVAELVAGQLDEQVRALVLLTPVPLAGTGLPDEVMKTFRALGGNPSAQRELRRNFATSLNDERLEALSQLGDGVEAAAVGVFADIWNRGHSLGAQHSRYKGPVLIVHGEADHFVTSEIISSAVAPRFDEPVIASVSDAGHWPHVEQPQALARILGEFLTTVERGPSTAAAGQGWTRAFEHKSATAFADAFAADIVLEAGALAEPVIGAEQVTTVMAAASNIYEALTFTHEATNGLRTYLEWEAQAFGGVKLSGITILTKNEQGKVVRAAIHHRPLGGLLKFSAELGGRLRGKVAATHFFSAA
jgi:pimeloyl-ACP methyl ester carboxylesterase